MILISDQYLILFFAIKLQMLISQFLLNLVKFSGLLKWASTEGQLRVLLAQGARHGCVKI